MIARGTRSFWTDRPLVVSFEVTHSCTANCRHCDKGGIKPEPRGLLRAEDYRRLRATLKPMAVQISGGEPLLRKDIEEIIRAIKLHNEKAHGRERHEIFHHALAAGHDGPFGAEAGRGAHAAGGQWGRIDRLSGRGSAW